MQDRTRIARSLVLGFVLATGPAALAAAHEGDSLERCTRSDALAARPSSSDPRDDRPADAAVEAEASRRLPPPSVDPPDLEAAATAAAATVAPLRFADHLSFKQRLKNLKRWREFALVRLWDDRRVQVYIGVDRGGTAGLHFRQRDPENAELATLASLAPAGDAPAPAMPPRAVPLGVP
ncbi:MAG: hypothetical protein O9284_09830 [Steroidobacteraceae bacterium]|jgi:hypothetical protein|nr:hypothetical protein [Steroidobacteraceae bacterium]